jgi:hypothetical protein
MFIKEYRTIKAFITFIRLMLDQNIQDIDADNSSDFIIQLKCAIKLMISEKAVEANKIQSVPQLHSKNSLNHSPSQKEENIQYYIHDFSEEEYQEFDDDYTDEEEKDH